MKNIVAFLFLFLTISSFAQINSKETHYYFQNSKITKTEFESLDKQRVYTRTIETDTAVFNHVFLHKDVGKLDSLQHLQIKMLLTQIVGTEFNPELKTLIHLYRKNDKDIYNDSQYKSYWKWIKNNSDQYQSFLLGTKDSQIPEDKGKHIFTDRLGLLEKLFFQNSDFQTNHLFLKPNGEIYIYFGLNDILYVLDWSAD